MWPAIIAGGISATASLYGADKAADQAEKDREAQLSIATAQLDFEQSQYDDWQAIFGPVSESLGDFYSSLDADTLTSLGLQENRETFAKEQEQLQRTFSQRGVETPAQQMMQQDASIKLAEREAQIRQNSPLQLAEAKSQFMGMGRNAVNPYGSGVSNAMSQQSSAYGASAARNEQSASAGYNAAGQALDGAISAYMTQQERDRTK